MTGVSAAVSTEEALSPSAYTAARTPLSRELWAKPANDQECVESSVIVRGIHSWLQQTVCSQSDALDRLLLPRPTELVPWQIHTSNVSNAVCNQRLRRAKILRAARNLVIERGCNGFTLNDIADASQVTVPTIYNLVGRRNDVIIACFDEFLRLVINIGLSDEDLVLDAVASLVSVGVPVILRSPEFVREIVLYMRDGSPALRQGLARQFAIAIREALRRMRSNNKLQAWVDIPLLASHISDQNAAITIAWAGGDISDEQLWATYVYKDGLVMMGCVSDQHLPTTRLMVQEAQTLSVHGSRALAC